MSNFPEQHRISLDHGTLVFTPDGTTLLSIAVPPEDDEDRYETLARRLRELADSWTQLREAA